MTTVKSIRVDKVFQIPKPSGNYENIKISVEADNRLDCLLEIYETFLMDRVVYYSLQEEEENIQTVLTRLKVLDAIRADLNPEELPF